jgi:hypothetical protein
MPSTRTSKTIVLEPDLEEMCARYTAAQKVRNASEHDEGIAEALLGDPMYGHRVRMPKWNIEVTMLQEPKVALRYWHSWGIPTSKDAHRQRAEYFRDLAKRFSDEWDDVVERAIDLYGTTPDGRKDRLAGTLISGVYRDHFPQDVKERLRFLAYGGQMIKDAARLHEFLSKTRSPNFR